MSHEGIQGVDGELPGAERRGYRWMVNCPAQSAGATGEGELPGAERRGYRWMVNCPAQSAGATAGGW